MPDSAMHPPAFCPRCGFKYNDAAPPTSPRCPSCHWHRPMARPKGPPHWSAMLWVFVTIPVMWAAGVVVFGVLLPLGRLLPSGGPAIILAVPLAGYVAGVIWCFHVFGRLGVLTPSPNRTDSPSSLPRLLLSGFLAAVFFPIVFMLWYASIALSGLIMSLF